MSNSLFIWIPVLLAAVWAAHSGAEHLSQPLKKLRRQWGLSVAAGGAFVGLAAASPEISINATSAIRGVADIGLGALLGSNVLAIPMMVLTAYVATRRRGIGQNGRHPNHEAHRRHHLLQVDRQAVTVQALPYLGILLLFALLTVPTHWRGLQPVDGWILLLGYVVYAVQAFSRGRQPGEDVDWQRDEIRKAVVGVGALAVGAYFTVWSTEKIVGALGISRMSGGMRAAITSRPQIAAGASFSSCSSQGDRPMRVEIVHGPMRARTDGPASALNGVRACCTGQRRPGGTQKRRRIGRRAPLAVLMVAVVGLASCDEFRFPRDPNGTLERVETTGTVRVGAVGNEPWVILRPGQPPAGAEVERVEAFAATLGAKIDWHRAPAFEALEALERGDLDLAIGGFTKTAVAAHGGVASTYSYYTDALVVGAERGASLPDDVEGLAIRVDPNLLASGIIAASQAIPVDEDAEGVDLVLVPNWKLATRDLVPTGIALHRYQRVMAIPQGENAWLMRLEMFLRSSAPDMAASLREYAR